jgi:hypothetical protein
MGLLPEIWYKNQSIYLKKALTNGLELIEAYSLSGIWRNITKLGCSYDPVIEQNCWDNCPSILRDEHLGVFKTPVF